MQDRARNPYILVHFFEHQPLSVLSREARVSVDLSVAILLNLGEQSRLVISPPSEICESCDITLDVLIHNFGENPLCHQVWRKIKFAMRGWVCVMGKDVHE